MPTGKPPVYPQPGNQGPVPPGLPAGAALFTIGSNAFLNAGAVAQGGTVTAVSQAALTLLGNPGTAAAHATTVPLGAGLAFAAGALTATAADQWHAGAVSFLSAGLSINSGTLTVQYSAGVLTSIGTGLNLTAGVLTAQWTAGVVSSVAGGLSIVGNVLRDQWSAGTVTSLGAGLTLTAGVLHT